MRNVFLFIARFSNLLFFLFLQVLALSMLFRYNKFHQAEYMNVANEVTGRFYVRYNKIETYFTLQKQNENLRQQNADLLNKLRSDFSVPDSAVQLVTDSFRVDSLEQYRKYLYLPAKVIGNSIDGQNNFVTLHRGSNQGVGVNMAVIGPEGVVGKIVNVSPNMSVAMSLLHRKNSVVALLKKGGGFGEVTWDGKDPRYVTLSNIPRTIKVDKGDTVVTSSYSDIFPPGKVVGYVQEVKEDKSSSTYNLKLRTATDFYSVQHAFIVKNMQKAEMDSLMKKVKKD
ncbi:MAG TPA: rod shape-determining protein MreC [Chitinophagaceae bacterium]|nr:rod shape-determining protein MreC [Chitinophagaceae bacterium]